MADDSSTDDEMRFEIEREQEQEQEQVQEPQQEEQAEQDDGLPRWEEEVPDFMCPSQGTGQCACLCCRYHQFTIARLAMEKEREEKEKEREKRIAEIEKDMERARRWGPPPQ